MNNLPSLFSITADLGWLDLMRALIMLLAFLLSPFAKLFSMFLHCSLIQFSLALSIFFLTFRCVVDTEHEPCCWYVSGYGVGGVHHTSRGPHS